MNRIIFRIRTAILTYPDRRAWLVVIGLLTIYGLIYLPIGFKLGFLEIDVQSSWQTVLGITLRAFLMPGISEEFVYRVLLIPHPRESVSFITRTYFIILSWLLFLSSHLHIFAPPFFHTPGFLIGAGFLGIVCTISYLQSGSFWTSVVIHWLIVVLWLLLFGGLKKFNSL